LRVRVRKCEPDEIEDAATEFGPAPEMPNMPERPPVLRFGKLLKGEPKGGAAPLEEWIGNRRENAESAPGVHDGHGSQRFDKKDH
jgi:hypothetical protein